MPRSYGQGEMSRIIGIKESLEKHFQELGLSTVPISDQQILKIALMLNYHYLRASEEILKPVDEFLEIIKNFAEGKKTVTFKMVNYIWNILIKQKNFSRYKVQSEKFRRGQNIQMEDIKFNLYHIFSVSDDEISQKLPAVVVQAFEVHIVYELISQMRTLNKYFKEKQLALLALTVNNDNLSINIICPMLIY